MDRKEFEQSAPRLRELVLGVARRFRVDDDEAEDVAQDTLLRLWSRVGDLDRYRSLESLAVVVARNRCIDMVRKRGESPLRVDIADVDIAAAALTPEEAMIAHESGDRAEGLLSQLPDGQRRVLMLKHVDGLETSEIAAITGSNENAVRVTLSRARHRIKELFDRMNEHDR